VTIPIDYMWQIPCRDAFFEADHSKMAFRLYEALAAIEQRFLSPVDLGSHEEMALHGRKERSNCFGAKW
jgi:hypothetical protein